MQATLTADELFADFLHTLTSQGPHAAEDRLDATLSGITQTKGTKASLDLHGSFIRRMLVEIGKHKPKLTKDTQDALKPIVDAVNNTMANISSCTRWTGDSFLRTFGDSIREIQGLAVQLQITGQFPHQAALRTLSQVSHHLILSLTRLLGEALPAIISAAEDHHEAEKAAQSAVELANLIGLIPLAETHQKLQSEMEQMRELDDLCAQSGRLVRHLEGVLLVVKTVALMTKDFAPQSNSQIRLVEAEANHYFNELLATLKQ